MKTNELIPKPNRFLSGSPQVLVRFAIFQGTWHIELNSRVALSCEKHACVITFGHQSGPASAIVAPNGPDGVHWSVVDSYN